MLQAIISQSERDQEIYALLDIMNKTYDLVLLAEPLNKIETHSKTLKLICQQTTECALFIRDYASHTFSMILVFSELACCISDTTLLYSKADDYVPSK
jgi:hypothetical protein